MNPETTTQTEAQPAQWAIIELMGHARAAGLVSRDTMLGTPMLRLDVPQKDGTFTTQLINPQSIYRMSFCEEAVARVAAEGCRQAPLCEWSLRHLLPETAAAPDPDNDDAADFT